jgi:hypothetical protein
VFPLIKEGRMNKMGKLNIMDLLSFAKAGYTPKDVKELLEMDIPEPSPKLPEEAPKIMEQKDAENAAKEPAQVLPSPDDNAGAEDIDYKKLYEDEVEKVKQLQKQNTMQDASAGKKEDPMKAVDDFLASLM